MIWTDTAENIATALNKTVGSVSLQRKIFLSENPNFIIPNVAKKQRNKKEKTNKVKNDWSAEQLSLLWSKPAMILSQEIGKNYREIGRKRVEWCLANPNFVIPHVAQFNSKGLPNKVERKKRDGGWTQDQENLIWEDTIENLVSILDKSYNSIYSKRQDFLQKNPSFTIPDCAKTVRKKKEKISHPVVEVKEAEQKANLFVKAVEVATEVKKKRAYNRKPKNTVSSPVSSPVSNTSSNTSSTPMNDVADFLNKLSVMPKKIKINGIELEF